MSSPQSAASEAMAGSNGRLAQQAYGFAQQAGSSRLQLLNGMLGTQGEPAYMGTGWQMMQGLQQDKTGASAMANAAKLRQSSEHLSGNMAAQLDPTMSALQLGRVGVNIATRRGMGALEQQTTTLESLLGLTGAAGNAEISAGRNQLGAIGMMQGVNPWLQGAAGLGAGAYGVAGAVNQAKMYGQWPGGSSGTLGYTSTPPNSLGVPGYSGQW